METQETIEWFTPGNNCTGDLRLIGVLSVLLAKQGVNTKIFLDKRLTENFVYEYLELCGVNVIEKTANQLSRLKKTNKGIISVAESHTNLPGNEILAKLNILQKDIDEHIETFRKHLKVSAYKEPNFSLVIWIKKHVSDAYHVEHLLHKNIMYKAIINIISQCILTNESIPEITIKDDTEDFGGIVRFAEELNLTAKSLYYVRSIATRSEALNSSLQGKNLFDQYKYFASEFPKNTIHFGGRSGHLEVMPFLGHRVVYYEEYNNPETDRIYQSLCTMKKEEGKWVMRRFQNVPQTVDGVARVEKQIEQTVYMRETGARRDHRTRDYTENPKMEGFRYGRITEREIDEKDFNPLLMSSIEDANKAGMYHLSDAISNYLLMRLHPEMAWEYAEYDDQSWLDKKKLLMIKDR